MTAMPVRIRYAFPYPGTVAKTLSGLVREVLNDVEELGDEDEARNDSPRDDARKTESQPVGNGP